MLNQNRWANSWVEFVGQIHRSNLPVKSSGQTQAILGPPLASLGARMDTPADGPKMA
jgi:hypothetical protein